MSTYAGMSDIIKRTRIILERYSNEKEFGRTFFINCCVGLLIAPQQFKLPENIDLDLGEINYDEWGINPNQIKKNSRTRNLKKLSVENIARHFRNSICHYIFDIKDCNPNGIIENIRIIDKDGSGKNANTTFDLTLTFDDFMKFVLLYSNTLEQKLKQI